VSPLKTAAGNRTIHLTRLAAAALKEHRLASITIQRFDEEDKIVEGWTIADTLGQMQQLGMAPGPEQVAES
jgi:hypothetical protein